MKRNNTPYFAIEPHEEEKTTDVFVFGDIASEKGGLSGLLQSSSDRSSHSLARELQYIPEDHQVVVHINSNGGELKEGLGIYNILKERDRVTTICEGFAASAASVIFCAGKTRIMQPASLLFIHQAWITTSGNSDELNKVAEDLRIITNAAKAAYKECGINIDDGELEQLLKNETWITPENALEMGFATEIVDTDEEDEIRNDAMNSIITAVTESKNVGRVELAPQTLNLLSEYTMAVNKSESLFELATKVLNAIDNDPEIESRVKGLVDDILATQTAPTSPARVENIKGFFGFEKPSN